jgi:hypothetical protein
MIRSALLLLVFSCTLLRADLLDDVSRQLDLMEGDYWLAQRSSDGDYHRAVQRRLDKLKNDVYRIWNQMRRVRKHDLVKFDVALNALSGNFGKLKPSVVQAFYFSFKKTSMSDYTREFRKLAKEKEEQAESEESDGKKRSKRRSTKVFPTLANVDVIEYERWLAERVSENLNTFTSRNSRFFRNTPSSRKSGKRETRRYRGFSSDEHMKVHNYVTQYLTAIKELRLGLVKARQSTNIEYK